MRASGVSSVPPSACSPSHSLAIRQIFVTDPVFSEDPKLVIILEDPLPAGVVNEIRALPQVRKVII